MINFYGVVKLKETWTVQDILDWTTEYFQKEDINRSRLEAEMLLAHSLQIDRLNLYLYPDRPLTEEELDNFRPMIKKRKKGVPIQYITEKVNFMGVDLKVDKRALIPRPETEEMIELILSEHKGEKGLEILDLGTGCGAIAVTLAKYLVEPQITASDISEEALELARENASNNEVENNTRFIKSDWFKDLDGQFDIIATNPPYVGHGELEDLDPKIKEHEPTIALNGGEKGLEEITNILGNADTYLKPSGCLYVEIGADQGERVKETAREQGFFDSIKTIKDSGEKDRILTAEKKGEV